ncbi:MAG: metallophosphoesterase [Clostridia bacterium]|nr:metallophosphoesterase [Clostridia bacterium]
MLHILVVSDAHGSTRNTKTAIEKTKPDAVIFLGDGIRQIEDLSYVYDDIPFHFVSGNCDFASNEPYTKLLKFGEKTVLATHGHNYSVKYTYSEIIAAAKSRGVDVVLFGHTHTPYQDYDDGLYVMNPGSVEQPREGRPSYGILDITSAGIVTNIVYL